MDPFRSASATAANLLGCTCGDERLELLPDVLSEFCSVRTGGLGVRRLQVTDVGPLMTLPSLRGDLDLALQVPGPLGGLRVLGGDLALEGGERALDGGERARDGALFLESNGDLDLRLSHYVRDNVQAEAECIPVDVRRSRSLPLIASQWRRSSWR